MKPLMIAALIGLPFPGVSDCLFTADPTVRFSTTLRKADDAIAIAGDHEKTTFTVTSPSGIGQAIVTRREEAWPKVVILRLRLKGLENLNLSNGKDAIGAAVASGEVPLSVRQWKGEKESAIELGDPLRLEIQVLDNKGQPIAKGPVEDGVFEVTVPAAFFKGNPEEITIRWIDFYR